jgi:hypothetical protein
VRSHPNDALLAMRPEAGELDDTPFGGAGDLGAAAPAQRRSSGGARQTPPKPPSHEQTLIAVLHSGEANVGANSPKRRSG